MDDLYIKSFNSVGKCPECGCLIIKREYSGLVSCIRYYSHDFYFCRYRKTIIDDVNFEEIRDKFKYSTFFSINEASYEL